MEFKQIFSDNLAYSVARFSSYERGKEYFEDGLVEKIWKEGNEYKAIVQGTKRYHVSMKFEDEELIFECNCPYEMEGVCKHVVAAIFAFTKDEKFISKNPENEKDKEKQSIENLLNQATDIQLRAFTGKFLKKHSSFTNDLQIFLHGQKQTPVTITQYKTKFKNKLNELDLSDLIQVWYSQGEDYYGDGYEPYSDTETLGEIADEYIEEAEKYNENQNQGEALKIYQALFESFGEKKMSLNGEKEELKDWFLEEMDKIFLQYVNTLQKTNNKNLKEIGIIYLCRLLEQQPYDVEQYNISSGSKNVIFTKDDAKIGLSVLVKTAAKKILTIPESSLLTYLYFLTEDYERFEKISLLNLKENPNIVLGLLKYYYQNNRKNETMDIAQKVLNQISSKKHDDFSYFEYPVNYLDLEIEIRKFLKPVFSPEINYSDNINNAEQLFLRTQSLSDYKELIKMYKNIEEKQKFWHEMKDYFSQRDKIKTIFKVFRLENKKEEVLNLIIKYPDSDCFPDMITFVQKEFPEQCFSTYKKKIEQILLETKVEKYEQAAYHLKRIKQIGKTQEFSNFLRWIKDTYWRRRKLLEELKSV